MVLPVGGHGPCDLFGRIGQLAAQNGPDAAKLFADPLVLREDVLVNSCRSLATVVALVLFAERASAFGAFPHSVCFLS